MYKLRVYIYSNHVPFDARQKSYEFKSSVNFGLPKKISKSPYVGRFSDFYVKNYRFQLVIWRQILSFS